MKKTGYQGGLGALGGGAVLRRPRPASLDAMTGSGSVQSRVGGRFANGGTVVHHKEDTGAKSLTESGRLMFRHRSKGY